MTTVEDRIVAMLAEQSDYYHDAAVIASVLGEMRLHVDPAILRLKAASRVKWKRVPDGRGGVEEVFTVRVLKPHPRRILQRSAQ